MDRIPIPGHPFYEITADGEVFRVGSVNPLRPVEAKRGGYLQVSLWEYGVGKTRYVHQLVALTFHGPRPSSDHDAAHDDGNKLNNRSVNVFWKTQAENERDKIRHGTTNRGERSGTAKLTLEQVREIRIRAQSLPRSSSGCRIKKGALGALAREYGVTRDCLSQIISGLRWKEAA